MLLNEVWIDISGYEGLYQVSNHGRIKSLNYHRTGKPKIMTPHKGTRGYLQIGLWKDSKCRRLYVHRLVAHAFCKNDDSATKTQINHKDENRLNNSASNLEWCTPKYNINYGKHNDKVSASNSKPVICIESGRLYESIKEASKETGVSMTCISDVCLGKKTKTKGMRFAFAGGEKG